MAGNSGPPPTVIVVVTALVAVSITEMVPSLKFRDISVRAIRRKHHARGAGPHRNGCRYGVAGRVDHRNIFAAPIDYINHAFGLE